MHRYSVLVPLPFDKAFDYLAPESMGLEIGSYVRVPFGSREVYGVVWGLSEETENEKKTKNDFGKGRASAPHARSAARSD